MKKSRSTTSDKTKGAAGGGIQRRKPQLMALEARLMFDGAAAATVPDQTAPALGHDVLDHAADVKAAEAAAAASATTAASASDTAAASSTMTAAAVAAPET